MHNFSLICDLISFIQVNVLTHAAEITFSSEHLDEIEKLKVKHKAQDEEEILEGSLTRNKDAEENQSLPFRSPHSLSGDFIENEETEVGQDGTQKINGPSAISENMLAGGKPSEGGALWDIFRREDVPKLQEYIKKHFREFRHIHCRPLKQVISRVMSSMIT